MEDIKIELKPKKKSFLDKVKALFEDKKKRYLYMILFILPFVVAIGIFGFNAYKEAKNLIDLVSGTTEIQDENKIESEGYVLRDNATDYQKQLFAELKQAIEVDNADEQTIVSLVCKNYVADFYTWTNKQGQYDIGGMCYLYHGEYIDGTHFDTNVYSKARDSFYKYINNYKKEYGDNDVLEIENVEVTKCSKAPYEVVINEHVENRQDEEGEWYDYREDRSYVAYDVTCAWTYKQNKMDTGNFATKMNFLVLSNGRIVAASGSEIDAREMEEIIDTDLELADETVDEETDESEE